MLPFKVFDREKKITWVILNYQSEGKGRYLAAREDDTDSDGELALLSSEEMIKLRMVGFVEEQE